MKCSTAKLLLADVIQVSMSSVALAWLLCHHNLEWGTAYGTEGDLR
jgi:hypothetical protein